MGIIRTDGKTHLAPEPLSSTWDDGLGPTDEVALTIGEDIVVTLGIWDDGIWDDGGGIVVTDVELGVTVTEADMILQPLDSAWRCSAGYWLYGVHSQYAEQGPPIPTT